MGSIVRGVTAALLLLALASPAFAETRGVFFLSGNAFHEQCESTDDTRAQYFVAGLVDTANSMVAFGGAAQLFCIPEGVLMSQLIDVACRYVDERADVRQADASGLVQAAFKAVWPCD